MRAAVVITTKNRKADLCRAIESALRQTVPIEVLVLDDGSTDGTSELVAKRFPQVHVDRSPNSLGCVAQRNRAALISSADILFSIDDDAEFSSPWVVEQTVSEFSHPRVAAVAIPYVEPHKGKQVFQKAPDNSEIWVSDSFRGTSYALRRTVFSRVGGYRDQLIHHGEEADLCIRFLRFGWVVRLGRSDEIFHYEAPTRDRRRTNFYARRNDVLFAWHNVPMPFFPLHLAATTLNGVRSAVQAQYRYGMMMGTLSGYSSICGSWQERAPVPAHIYRLHRLLKKQGPKPISIIEPFLPATAFETEVES